MRPDVTPLATAAAPGKLILLGEHAAVYGRPAVAVPVWAVEARATVWPSAEGLRVTAHFPDGSGRLPLVVDVASADRESTDDPLAAAVWSALAAVDDGGQDRADSRRGNGAESTAGRPPRWSIELESSIPVGVGLGSSAAVAVALVRAVGLAGGRPFEDGVVARLALEAEKRTHGHPSGIDNTVIALGRPVSFRQGKAAPLGVGRPVRLVVADSGQVGLTRKLVAEVRDRHGREPERYDAWFDRIGRLAEEGAVAMARGDLPALGRMLDENHGLLQSIGVSTPVLDEMARAARDAGALGAKLSGAGGGGVVLALVEEGRAGSVASALHDAGAARVLCTTVPATP